MITGVGTGGHITGVAEILKAKFPSLKVFAVEPELSPVISGGSPSPHPIQGIGAGFIPSILNTDILDGVITVSKEDSFDSLKGLRRKKASWLEYQPVQLWLRFQRNSLKFKKDQKS